MNVARKNDLSVAEDAIKGGGPTIAVAREGKVLFYTDTPGLKAIFEASKRLGGELRGAAVADRVVGKAAALLYVHLQVNAVFGALMSEGAAKVLRGRGVEFRFKRIIPAVKGKDGVDVCPFEMRVMHISEPEEGFRAVSEMLFGRLTKTSLKGLS